MRCRGRPSGQLVPSQDLQVVRAGRRGEQQRQHQDAAARRAAMRPRAHGPLLAAHSPRQRGARPPLQRRRGDQRARSDRGRHQPAPRTARPPGRRASPAAASASGTPSRRGSPSRRRPPTAGQRTARPPGQRTSGTGADGPLQSPQPGEVADQAAAQREHAERVVGGRQQVGEQPGAEPGGDARPLPRGPARARPRRRSTRSGVAARAAAAGPAPSTCRITRGHDRRPRRAAAGPRPVIGGAPPGSLARRGGSTASRGSARGAATTTPTRSRR